MSNIKSPITVSPQNLYATSSTQGIDLGAYVETSDGRGFRYVAAGGTALVPGKLQQAAAESTANYERLSIAAAGTQTFLVTITSSTTIAANVLNGGLLTVSVTPGQGYSYKIASHTATSSATGAVITLEDPIQVALTTSSKINLVPNPYNQLVVNPTTATSIPVGVAVSPIAGTWFGWVQTRGQVGCLIDATAPAVGATIAPSTLTAGAVGGTAGTQVSLGYSLQTTTSAEYANIFLTID